ncbi:winged helix-turn-helix domain-containing tetratricopeptide repeat protein [Bradyrhizobium sp. CB1015]|uniref:winged helix-turn-helix domain-containing tetratricopeptide repeat protein n=1 Tax=Bradyrhizobium sp. CB1015 TaxID=2976822 RepID=UPI0021AA8E3D|nr:winged helix-turn-helix domain-containing tetratricopeptide repeat protein [Bradyrhizobium sp. CB1015]UWU94189.1 winged helix-turn-helix domain-containing tetratricopeptide repeat protein [Bradyrhizobium sp. CB1015]
MPFLFEDYRLDAERRELKRGSELIAVGPKVFDLLLFLVRNREQVVTRDDLLEAVWEGRIVSESTLTSHVNAVRKAIGDTGKEQRLIRTVSRKGLRFVGHITEEELPRASVQPVENIQETIRAFEVDAATGAREAAPFLAAAAESPPPLPDKPSIAVLPFQNMSGDVEQEYFADGMAEDIITALSRFKEPFVIARNSSFTYKARAVDVKQVGRELGVRYVLEGSVRKVANRVRITGQLVDAATGAHIWADRFDGELGDIFELQDQVTESVVGAIAPAVEKAEIERAKRKPTASLDAYALYLRGLAQLHQFGNRQANEEALRLFKRAIELDPEFASAYGRAAFCYLIAKINGWIPDTANAITEVKKLARRGVELGKDDPIALSAGGNALAFVVGDLGVGAGLVDRALTLNSNLAEAWNFGGWVKLWLGEPESAIERFSRAIRLSPLDPWLMAMRAGTAYAHFFLDRHDEAASWAAMALQCSPDYGPGLRITAASNAMAGRPEQAQKAVARLRELSPTLRLSNFKDVIGPYRRAEDVARYEEGLRKAGLPE